MERYHLNEIYIQLDRKAKEISKHFNCTFGYYNGHYNKNESGNYEIDYFPIHVISIEGVCDIEIDLNQITITTKLTRDRALSFDYEKIKSYNFEAYGVEEYLDDFYLAGDSIENMLEKIKKSKEENIFFSFIFENEVNTDTIFKFVEFIKIENFFY